MSPLPTFTSERIFPEMNEETSLPECPCNWVTRSTDLPMLFGLSGFTTNFVECAKKASVRFNVEYDPVTGELISAITPLYDFAEIIMEAKRSFEPPLQTTSRRVSEKT